MTEQIENDYKSKETYWLTHLELNGCRRLFGMFSDTEFERIKASLNFFEAYRNDRKYQPRFELSRVHFNDPVPDEVYVLYLSIQELPEYYSPKKILVGVYTTRDEAESVLLECCKPHLKPNALEKNEYTHISGEIIPVTVNKIQNILFAGPTDLAYYKTSLIRELLEHKENKPM